MVKIVMWFSRLCDHGYYNSKNSVASLTNYNFHDTIFFSTQLWCLLSFNLPVTFSGLLVGLNSVSQCSQTLLKR